MGYRTTWGNANKQTSEGLAIRYTCEPLSLSDSSSYYKVTRYATKNYSFVGMDRATAMQCAEAKAAQYTRGHTHVASKSVSGDGVSTTIYTTYTSYDCLCSVAVEHGSGGMWNVTISVSETDEALTDSVPASMAACFSITQNYDEDDSTAGTSIVLKSVFLTKTQGSTHYYGMAYTANVADFNEEALVVQWAVQGDVYQTVAYSEKYWGYPCTASSGKTVNWRLCYGSNISEVVSVVVP